MRAVKQPRARCATSFAIILKNGSTGNIDFAIFAYFIEKNRAFWGGPLSSVFADVSCDASL